MHFGPPDYVPSLGGVVHCAFQLTLGEIGVVAFDTQLGLRTENQSQKRRLSHQFGMAHGVGGGAFRFAPLSGLPIGKAEIVVGLRGASPVAQPVIGQQRFPEEPGGLV